MGSVRSSPLASPKPGAAVQARAPRSPEAVGRWCRLGVTVLVVLALLVLLMAVALSIAQTGHVTGAHVLLGSGAATALQSAVKQLPDWRTRR